MYRNDQPFYQLKRLEARAPTRLSSDAVRQARRKRYLWTAALLLELCITLSVCATAVLLLAGGDSAQLPASLLGAGLELVRPSDRTTVAEDTPAAPTVRVLATGTVTRTPARPVSNTGISNSMPNASPTRARTYTPVPAGKSQKAATPTQTRISTRTPTATATRNPPTP